MKGVLVIISGFSGAGKGTIVKELVQRYPYSLSVSATTRAPRQGEIEGKDYFFKTKEEFEQMIREDRLIEYAQYVDNYYGTPRDYVLKQLEAGTDVILEIEMQGAMRVKEKFPDVSLIFITPPSAAELQRRLRKRGTEPEEVISQRLSRAREECAYMPRYDYIIVNDELEDCVEQVHNLIRSLHWESGQQGELIEKITKDFKNL